MADPEDLDPDQPESADKPRAVQPTLFEIGHDGRLRGHVGLMPELTADSSLDVARYWYRRHLEQSGRPKNTVNSYSYDLAIFENLIGPKPLHLIGRRDIGYYLDDSRNKSTRKRRLTSVSGLFKYLTHTAQILPADPTEGFYPEHIPLKTPHPLFADEQERLLVAAAADSPRAHAAIWLMLRLGVSRAELLQLRPEHIDFSDPERPVVYIYYADVRLRGKERKLAAGPDFQAVYDQLVGGEPPDPLFPILPQSVNKLVERVARAAGITKRVTPQSLRDTFAVDRAREGMTEEDLLTLLGLADDTRNRMSVQRYIKLAAPPLLSPKESQDGDAGSAEARLPN